MKKLSTVVLVVSLAAQYVIGLLLLLSDDTMPAYLLGVVFLGQAVIGTVSSVLIHRWRKDDRRVQVGRALAAEIFEKQIAPQRLAAELRQQGHNVDVGLVDPSPDATGGFEVTCVGCGRTARATVKPPADKEAVCPPCQRAGRL